MIHDFALWNGDRLLGKSDRTDPTDPVTLHGQRSEDESLQDLSILLHASDPNKPPVDSTVVFGDLHNPIATGESRGLGRLVAAVHRAARPFREEA